MRATPSACRCVLLRGRGASTSIADLDPIRAHSMSPVSEGSRPERVRKNIGLRVSIEFEAGRDCNQVSAAHLRELIGHPHFIEVAIQATP